MGRMIDIDDVVDVAEISARTGELETTIHNWPWWRHDPMPAPWWHRGRCKLWLWSDLLPWLERHGKLRP